MIKNNKNYCYCAACKNLKLIKIGRDDDEKFLWRVDCLKNKLLMQYKLYTVARRVVENCREYEPLVDNAIIPKYLKSIRRRSPIKDIPMSENEVSDIFKIEKTEEYTLLEFLKKVENNNV